MDTILNLHIFSTIFMSGLIWVIQLVHYPSYKYISETEFESFQRFHVKNITIIVAPVMTLELITSFLILYRDFSNLILILNTLTIGLIWVSTFFLSIPCHGQLTKNKDLKVINRLVATNWIRTIIWSVRLILIYKISI